MLIRVFLQTWHEYQKQQRQHVYSRSRQVLVAFDFWGLEALEAKGRKGIYELRSYTLKVRCRERERRERKREREEEALFKSGQLCVVALFLITAGHFDRVGNSLVSATQPRVVALRHTCYGEVMHVWLQETRHPVSWQR